MNVQVWMGLVLDQSQAHLAVYFSTLPVLVIIITLLTYSLFSVLKKWTTNFTESDDKLVGSPPPQGLTRLASLLFCFSLMGFTVGMISLVYPNLKLTMLSPTFAWACAFVIILTGPKRPFLPCLPLVYFGILVAQVALLIGEGWNGHQSFRAIMGLISAGLSLAAIMTIFIMPIRDSAKRDPNISPIFATPNSGFRSPEDNLTVWQFMTVSWMAPLISLGRTRQLNDEDIWSLGYEFKHRLLFERFKELQGQILGKLLRANGLDMVIVSGLGIIELIANLMSPVLLRNILQSIDDPLISKKIVLMYAFLVLIARCTATQSSVFNLWYARRMYERSRGEMITTLHEKLLSRKVRLPSKDTIGEMCQEFRTDDTDFTYKRRFLVSRVWRNLFIKPMQQLCGRSRAHQRKKKDDGDMATTGKIINLMRFDVYEVAQRFWEFSSIVIQPLRLLSTVALIWHLIGWPCLLGVTTVILAQIINALLARILMYWERNRKEATDVKLQRISQFVEAVRHLRYYAWQDVWLNSIMEARQHELRLRIVTSLWRTSINFLNILANGLFPVVAFWAMTYLSGKPLKVDVAFPALQLFSMLESSLVELPALVMALFNAAISIERLDRFMLEPDLQSSDYSTGPDILLRNASFAWPGTCKPVLRDLNLSFQPGLTVICGEVGAGKSALLQALLGELDLLSGEYLRYNGMIGYCCQTPWLQNMTIRDNILFSAPYEEIRYKQTIESCALLPDMANFEFGDFSMVGENGVGLSGGQKARISLARAVYSRANILLLDDPLSSLDYQTAELIVQRCFKGSLLRGRTTILVTHRTELCSDVGNKFIVISNGKASVVNTLDSSFNVPPRNDYVESADEDSEIHSVENQTSKLNKFVEDEHRASGGVRLQVYWEYIKAGRLKWWFILILVLALFRLIEIGETWFLKEWGEAYGRLKQQELSLFGRFFNDLPPPETDIWPWLIGLLLLTIAEAISYIMSQGIMLKIIYQAGKNLFEKVMMKVTFAKFRFYDTTPVGRLMNRLTSDINTVDGNISNQFHDVIFLSLSWIFSIVTIGSIAPPFLIFALGLSWAFLSIFLHFLPTSQSLRRLEMVSLTPLISNFGAVTDGLTTIRAYRASSRFQDRVIEVTDNFQKMDHFYWSLQAWLMYRFDTLSTFFTFILTLLGLYMNISAGLFAFILTASSRFVAATHNLCKKYGQLQMDFVSVERVVELLEIPQEVSGKIIPPASWPHYGSDVILENVSIRYAPHLELILSDISFTIPGGSTTVVCGRTGSGKSTLSLALLGVLPPSSGRIIIDGLDITKIDLQSLRSRISFLAQDPILFPGTLQKNLDPLAEYTEDHCQIVLNAISADRNYEWSLQTPLDTGGRNLSQGQRQLVGLARVLLKRSPIVILDEATASVDAQMAKWIQSLIREWMPHSTILVIAHRPEPVRDAQIIVHLKQGKIIKTERVQMTNT